MSTKKIERDFAAPLDSFNQNLNYEKKFFYVTTNIIKNKLRSKCFIVNVSRNSLFGFSLISILDAYL